ncbi:MAG: AI-2E family transporter [Weeksellaceae bacterium]|nr:AI-2E family transporter [Weeksellaceae bacterium]
MSEIKLRFSALNYFLILGSFMLTIAGLKFASGFLVPFAFSVLFAFILMPFQRRLEKRRVPKAIAIFILFGSIIAVLYFVIFFFSTQISKLVQDMEDIQGKTEYLINSGLIKLQSNFPALEIDRQKVMLDLREFAERSSGTFLSSTFNQTTSFLAATFLVPVYVFLLLFFRKGIKEGILYFFAPEKRDTIESILYEVQGVGKDYVLGLATVVGILAVVNSTALLIIGLDYAILFGIFTAMLIIIPFVGTYIGSALPILYALVTHDAQMAFMVLIAYVVIQLIEGNFLTPKIVGNNTSVNAAVAFIAIIIGGYVWGMAGMILSIPFLAMLKKIFRHVEELKPVAILMGESLYDSETDELHDEVRKTKTPNISWRTQMLNFLGRTGLIKKTPEVKDEMEKAHEEEIIQEMETEDKTKDIR